MTVHGHIENGAVVIDDNVILPDGAKVVMEIEGLSAPLHNPYGMLADDPTGITEEDIAEIRKEMWANFPRDF